MGYISNKLCHFVGRSLDDDTARMNLLIKIIRSGTLLANPKRPTEAPSIQSNSEYKKVDSLGEAFQSINCVCFCDIPDEDLTIHTEKYSKVGLAFSKEFLSKAGARPVQYVPSESNMLCNMIGCPISPDPAQYFVDISRFSINSLLLLDMMNIEDNRIIKMMLEEGKNKPAVKALAIQIKANLPELFNGISLHAILYTLMHHSMNANAYVKLFDPTLAEDDPQNYYMEREWRSLNDVHFSLEDIVSIYLPNEEILQEMFVQCCPELENKIIVID